VFAFYLFLGFDLFCLSSYYFLFFFFLEFIGGVRGLRWLCRGGIVAYYVECTNVVKKWNGSDCVNRVYQGRRGWASKLISAHSTVRLVWARIERADSSSLSIRVHTFFFWFVFLWHFFFGGEINTFFFPLRHFAKFWFVHENLRKLRASRDCPD